MPAETAKLIRAFKIARKQSSYPRKKHGNIPCNFRLQINNYSAKVQSFSYISMDYHHGLTNTCVRIIFILKKYLNTAALPVFFLKPKAKKKI